MKKLIIAVFAALGFVACNDNSLNDADNGFSGKVETSYISINLSSAEKDSRAEGGIYQDGLEAERAVKSAYFFFFDADGNAFPVTATPGNPATEPGSNTDVNWISANLNDLNVGETPNVSDIKDAVLVLSTYVGVYPSQIVAVINWAPDNKAYNLDELYAATNIQGVDNGFVMSNAVYSNGQDAVVGTPITEQDIFTNPSDALNKPITIHVERIAAKVTVTANNVTEGRYKVVRDTNISISGEDTEVYVKVVGWNLHNDFTESKLLKEINPSWQDGNLGFTWNDSPYYRCYWATSLGFSAISGNNAFPETFPYFLGDAAKVNRGEYDANTYTYIGENTNYDVVNNKTDQCTKVIINAKLQRKTSEGTYEDLPLARWYTTYYEDLDALLRAVANTIKYQYSWYNQAESSYVYIAPEDLTVVKEDNMVKFQLSTTGESRNWYLSNGTIAKTKDEMNVNLGALEKAIYYEDGYTLYAVDIKHLGNGQENAHKAGDYGVVRNHIYNLVLNSFGGFGSPVYVPGANLEYPDDPEISKSDYVSAEVRVLSWRVVTQQVNVQP